MTKRIVVGFGVSLIVAIVMAVPSRAFGPTSVKLFAPVAIALSDSTQTFTDFESAVPFAERQLFMTCDATDTASISGPALGPFIVDNYVQVQVGTTLNNFCPDIATKGCFAGTTIDPKLAIGQPAEFAYTTVAAQDITTGLSTGGGPKLYTFRLMDWGYTLAASEVWLNTTCVVHDKVCHRDFGKPGGKTLTVGAAAISAHLAHGDTLGSCQ